jgi:threonine dehydrogenase-like Zn-dependent dehydrogenase
VKAVVWHGVGAIRLDDVEDKIQEPTDAIEAYETFDRWEPGWIKVELNPTT